MNRAEYLLGLDQLTPPALLNLKVGSREGLAEKIGDRNGGNALYAPDELGHFFEKAKFSNASFPYALNSLFYRDVETFIIAHGRQIRFNARLSIAGGLTDEQFEDAFGAATTAGLYDLFLFGQCPSGFNFLYRPDSGARAFPISPEAQNAGTLPVEVDMDPGVWDARDAVLKAENINPRVLEIAMRAAEIAAAFDGRQLLRADELTPAWELARYQERVRMLLAPNPGKTFEAQVAHKILNHLNRHAPDGQWVNLRDLLRRTRAYDFGPSVVERTIHAMVFGGAVEEFTDAKESVQPGRKPRLIRSAFHGSK